MNDVFGILATDIAIGQCSVTGGTVYRVEAGTTTGSCCVCCDGHSNLVAVNLTIVRHVGEAVGAGKPRVRRVVERPI